MVEEHEIGQRIRDARRLRGLSQAALARKAGIDSNTIGGIEIGRRTPRHLTLTRIAEAMDMSVLELWGEEDPKEEAPEQAESPEAGAERLERGALADILTRLSEWGRESAEADHVGATLLRNTKLVDDVYTRSFSLYHSLRERGDEADDLDEPIMGMAEAFDALIDALKEFARREADPETTADVIELLAPRRRAESTHQALHREVG